jgi:cytochrome c-type biogenesis protein
VVALLWDRHQDRLAPLLTGRHVTLRIGQWRRRLALGNALAGALMIIMGVLAGVLAFTGTAMPTEGWQIRVSAWLQHASTVTVNALSWLPGWLIAAALPLGFAYLLRRRRGSAAGPTRTPIEESEHDQQDIR